MRTIFWMAAVILTAGALLLLIGLGRPPSVSEATADFCADMSTYGRALLDLRVIDENSTVEELQDAWAAVEDSREATQTSAAALRTARMEEVEAAHDQLRATIDDIPDDATLATAQPQLRLGALNAVASVADMLTTTCQITIPPGTTTRTQR